MWSLASLRPGRGATSSATCRYRIAVLLDEEAVDPRRPEAVYRESLLSSSVERPTWPLCNSHAYIMGRRTNERQNRGQSDFPIQTLRAGCNPNHLAAATDGGPARTLPASRWAVPHPPSTGPVELAQFACGFREVGQRPASARR